MKKRHNRQKSNQRGSTVEGNKKELRLEGKPANGAENRIRKL
jgi:hypothetical protein